MVSKWRRKKWNDNIERMDVLALICIQDRQAGKRQLEQPPRDSDKDGSPYSSNRKVKHTGNNS